LLGCGALLSARLAFAQAVLPPLPDSTGWGVHVLTAARDAQGALWVGTYGAGIYRLPAGADRWLSIRHDSTTASIIMDLVQPSAAEARGEVWYGTIGIG